VLLGVMVISNSSPTLHSTSAATDLFGLTSSLRSPMLPQTLGNRLPGSGPWKDLALASIESANACNRDISANAMNGIKDVMGKMNPEDRNMVVATQAKVRAAAADMLKAGQVAPLGFFDPAGLSSDISDGRLLFYREAEIKHGRICMLAVLGTLVGEQFHPLLGGADVGGVTHFQSMADVDIDAFWKGAFLQNIAMISYLEIAKSLPTIAVPSGAAYQDLNVDGGDAFAMGDMSRTPGDLGFDPLGLKPKNEKDLLAMQNKEILNGRLAMIAAIGIIAQEVVTGQHVFR